MTARWLAFLRGHHRAARAEAEQAEQAANKVREEVTVPLREMRSGNWITRDLARHILDSRKPPPSAQAR